MFWGVTIENGKKYSQIVEASYHLSMAALEPRTKPPPEGERYVSLMLEHMKTEFLLCNLEYNKTMQCPLDLMFKEGEEVTFYLQGKGVVHLTGFIVRDDFDEEDDDEDEEEEITNVTKKTSPKKAKLLDAIEAASSGSDDDEWDPSATPNVSGKRPLNGSDIKTKKAKKDEEMSSLKKLQGSDKKSPSNGSKKFKAEPSDDDDEDDSDEDDDLDDSGDDSDNAIDIDDDDDDDDDDDSDSDDDEEDTGNSWGMKAFGGIKNQKGGQVTTGQKQKGGQVTPGQKQKGGQTPGQNQKKKQAQQSFHDKTPQGGNNQKQKTPQGGKGGSQQQQQSPQTPKSPQSGKKNQNQQNKTPNQAQAQNAKTPNQTPASKQGPENSFQQTPGSKKKNKKQKNQQTPNTSNNQSPQIGEPKTPGGGKQKKLPSGIQIEDVLEGKGPVAKPGKYVHVYYTGKLNNNKEFDSLTKGKPFGFRLGKGEVIKGWDVALDGMKVGGKRKVLVPPNMGYGNKSQGPIPPNSTLHFEVELKAVN